MQIYQGRQGKYYVINGIKYDEHFPQKWAVDHMKGTDDFCYEVGPEVCFNCRYYGKIRGVFVGYCINCADEYNFKRGNGFGFKQTQEEMWESLDYMKDVKLCQIGDLVETRRLRKKKIPKKIIEDRVIFIISFILIVLSIYLNLIK